MTYLCHSEDSLYSGYLSLKDKPQYIVVCLQCDRHVDYDLDLGCLANQQIDFQVGDGNGLDEDGEDSQRIQTVSACSLYK